MNTLATPLCDTLLKLCQIPSPTGEEKALCDYIQTRLSQSLATRRLSRFYDSLIVHVAEQPGKPRVALVGHLDTVCARHDGGVRVEGNKLYGAGAADMKSGLAVMVELAERIDFTHLPFDLTMIFYEQEEGPFKGNRLGSILDHYRELSTLDLAVCLEPSDNEMQLGAMGSIHATLTCLGRSAHSARPWQGENAIYKAAALLQKLQMFEPHEVECDGHSFKEVMTPTLIQGGRARNVVADEVEINLNYRFAPGQSLDEAVANLSHLLGNCCMVQVTDRAPAGRPHADHGLVQHLSQCGVSGIRTKQAWTDVARFDAAGVPGVNLGPGAASQAHQPNEWTEIDKMVDGYQIFERFLTTKPLESFSLRH